MSWCDYKKGLKEDEKYYCNKCSKQLFGVEKMRQTKLRKGKSFYYWCKENNRQDILDLWDYELNKSKPYEINCQTSKRFYFKCIKGMHNSELKSVGNFVRGHEKSLDCRQCNSFAQWGIDNLGEDFLEKYWDYEKNTINPWDLDRCSSRKVWIKCQEKDYHSSYEILCSDFSKGIRCNICYQERESSLLQEKVYNYINKFGYIVLHESKCTLNPINNVEHFMLKRKLKLKYDNEIIFDNNIHLIIEVHGVQHYELGGFHKLQSKKNNTTPEYELEYQQLKDKYKKDYALSQGYYYLEIPYFTDDKEETWKRLIDDKINNIKLLTHTETEEVLIC